MKKKHIINHCEPLVPKIGKTIEKPSLPMVDPARNHRWWWWKFSMTIAIPSLEKNNHHHSIALKNWPLFRSMPDNHFQNFADTLGLASSVNSEQFSQQQTHCHIELTDEVKYTCMYTCVCVSTLNINQRYTCRIYIVDRYRYKSYRYIYRWHYLFIHMCVQLYIDTHVHIYTYKSYRNI